MESGRGDWKYATVEDGALLVLMIGLKPTLMLYAMPLDMPDLV